MTSPSSGAPGAPILPDYAPVLSILESVRLDLGYHMDVHP
jgi:hypothetical protein